MIPSYNGGGGITYQRPRTGNNFCALHDFSPPLPNTLYRNFRMYAIGQLNSNLMNGKSYCGKVYINLDNRSPYKINQFGIYVDDGTIMSAQPTCSNVINVSPQVANSPAVILSDTLNWIKIEGSFVATGNENKISFGNFKTDAATIGIPTGFVTGYIPAFYNIDDLSLILTEITAYAGNDATICISDSLHLGRLQEIGLECEWYKPKVTMPFATTSDIWFKPTEPGTYTFIQKMDNCQITYDTVNITVINDCVSLLPMQTIPNVFTPNEDGVNDAWMFSLGKGNSLNELNIYNRWGNLIKTNSLKSNTYVQWDGHTTSGEACSPGVYFYTLEYMNSQGEIEKKNGYVTLIR